MYHQRFLGLGTFGQGDPDELLARAAFCALAPTLALSGGFVRPFSAAPLPESSIFSSAPLKLDPWCMSSEDCWLRLASDPLQSAIIYGSHDTSLIQVTDAISAPRLAVIDADHWNRRHLPSLDSTTGVLLVGRDQGRLATAQVELEVLRGKPCAGKLLVTDGLLAALKQQTEWIPTGRLCRQFATRLQLSSWWPTFLQMATKDDIEAAPDPAISGMRLGVAYDEAFSSRDGELFELLETHGVQIEVFSPLHDEKLPHSDLLYFGHADINGHLNRLSLNCCFKQALRRRVLLGGRVFAEGAGAGYFGASITDRKGQTFPMVGLSSTSVVCTDETAFSRREVRLTRSNSFGEAGDVLSGYRCPGLNFLNHDLATEQDLVTEQRGVACSQLRLDLVSYLKRSCELSENVVQAS